MKSKDSMKSKGMNNREMVFKNRAEAGKILAAKLQQYRDCNALVLALPRGGVPVAAEIASALNAEFDIVIARKIGAPGNPEMAIGAVTSDGATLLNDSLIATLGVSEDYLNCKIEQANREIAEYVRLYRGERSVPRIANRIVLIVDDGIATGYTVLAAAKAILRQDPEKLIIAAPVGPRESVRDLQRITGCQVVTVDKPVFFIAVGQFYDDFEQLSDDEVRSIIRGYDRRHGPERKAD